MGQGPRFTGTLWKPGAEGATWSLRSLLGLLVPARAEKHLELGFMGLNWDPGTMKATWGSGSYLGPLEPASTRASQGPECAGAHERQQGPWELAW